MGKKLAEKLTEVWNTDTIQELNRPPELHFRFVGEKEIISLVKSLNLNKSTQVPDISMVHLKNSLLTNVPEMVNLVNDCVRTSTMLYTWKIGYITSIPEAGASYYKVDSIDQFQFYWHPVRSLKERFITKSCTNLGPMVHKMIDNMGSGKTIVQVLLFIPWFKIFILW